MKIKPPRRFRYDLRPIGDVVDVRRGDALRSRTGSTWCVLAARLVRTMENGDKRYALDVQRVDELPPGIRILSLVWTRRGTAGRRRRAPPLPPE